MNIQAVNFNWKLLGARLAKLSNDEQSSFFSGFALELKSFETHIARETQILSVGEKLKKNEREILEEYLPSLWF